MMNYLQITRLDRQGRKHYSAKKYTEALSLFEKQVEICRNLGDMDKLQLALNNVGCALQEIGEWEKSIAIHAEQEAISRQHHFPYGLALSLLNQAEILEKNFG